MVTAGRVVSGRTNIGVNMSISIGFCGNFAAYVDGDFLRQVAAGDGGRHFGDVADLRGEVARHRIDAVGQFVPGAGDGEGSQPRQKTKVP
jgi:hypothetical protein